MALALNSNPTMTRYLVEEKRVFADNPLVIVDVGARWGMNSEWSVFGDQMRVLCFEADKEECARLAEKAPPFVQYIPAAVGRSAGVATLYMSKLAASTSLYKTQMDYFGRLVNRDNGVVVGEQIVEVRPLDAILPEYGVHKVDFIKLDAEGAELDILQGGGEVLRSSCLGILSEIRLHPQINGSPPFSTFDAFVRQWCLDIYNLHVTRQSRVALPYPQLSDYRLPDGKKFFAYTTHGQVQDGDALYFRDLARVEDIDPVTVLKLCALFEIYCLADCAGELVQRHRDRLAPLVDPSHLLNLLTISVSGGTVSYDDYIADYFDDRVKRAPEPEPAVETASKAGWFGRLLGRKQAGS